MGAPFDERGTRAGDNGRAASEWRMSGGRERRQSTLPRPGPVLAAIAIVAAMVYGLHLLFV